MPTPRVSVVVPNCNEGDKLRMTVDSLLTGCRSSLEIIVVDNGSRDGSADFLEAGDWRARGARCLRFGERLGVAGARNTGAAQARGHLLMFCDAHVLFPQGWDTPLLDALDDPAVGIVSPLLAGWPGETEVVPSSGQRWTGPLFHAFEWLQPTTPEPHPVPLLCGAVQAFRRETFEWLGRYDGGMQQWGAEDHEISLRAWLLGLQLLSVPAITARHLFREAHLEPVAWFHVLYNDLRLAYAHFGPERVTRVVAALAGYPGFEAACAQAAHSDIWDRRLALDALRVHEDDWFFERFGMSM